MSTPQPFPWQVTLVPQEKNIAGYLSMYDEAKRRAKEAAIAGQWGVESAWEREASKKAELIVEKVRELLK